MIVTTYTCDRCGHEQCNDIQMWRIEVRIQHHGYQESDQQPNAEKLWCRPCIDAAGFYRSVPMPPPAPQPPPPLTFEELIRELIRNVVREEQP